MKHPRILLIKWNVATFRQISAGACESYRILSVPEDRSPLAFASEMLPDILYIPDFQMPEDLVLMKSLRKTCPDSIIFCQCAKNDSSVILAAFRAGAADVFTGPVTSEGFRESMIRLGKCQRKQVRAWLQPISRFWKSLKGTSVPVPVENRPAALLSLQADPDVLELEDSLLNRAGKWVREKSYFGEEVKPNWQHTTGLGGRFLGDFELYSNGQKVKKLGGKKAKSILAYLLFYHRKRIAREVLMDLFWPNSTPESARNSLNVALHGLRKALHTINPDVDHILFRDECYQINTDLSIGLDVDEFLERWRAGRSKENQQGRVAAVYEYKQAISCYQGIFLADSPYEVWIREERENLKEIYLVMLERLSEYFEETDPAVAIGYSKSILESDNCRENIYRRLMACYHRMGQRSRAIRQFHRCRSTLRSELEVEPTQATFELYETIRHT